MAYINGVSDSGRRHAFNIVGVNAMTSIATAMHTEIVGSRKIIQGINPSNAVKRNMWSLFRIIANPYLNE
jgi:hypothetical protein